MANENDWFAPKRFGYGAGLPITWQGWAVTIAFSVGLIIAGILLTPRHPMVFAAIAVIATVPLIAVSARHTRGGWRWRWGHDD